MSVVARFRNRKIHHLWFFAFVWDVAVAVLTWLVAGEPSVLLGVRILFLGAFIGAAVLVTWLALSESTLAVDVLDDRAIVIVRRWPLRRTVRRVAAGDVPAAQVVDEPDHEGDPYFACRLTLADGTAVDLAEGGKRPRIEAEAARFNAVAGSPFSRDRRESGHR